SRETIYVSSTQIKAVITDSDLASVGTFPITVFTPTPGGGTSSSQTFTVVTVNHAPTFTMGSDQSVLKNAGAQSVSGWASSIASGGDGNQAPYTFIVSNNNNALFSSQPAITVSGTSGTLNYTPATDATGSALVTVQLKDSGGTAGGGTDTSSPQTFYIN